MRRLKNPRACISGIYGLITTHEVGCDVSIIGCGSRLVPEIVSLLCAVAYVARGGTSSRGVFCFPPIFPKHWRVKSVEQLVKPAGENGTFFSHARAHFIPPPNIADAGRGTRGFLDSSSCLSVAHVSVEQSGLAKDAGETWLAFAKEARIARQFDTAAGALMQCKRLGVPLVRPILRNV